jgi:hypothetical protein
LIVREKSLAYLAFKGTMRLMEKIDEVIEAHGGWPIE